MTIQNLGSLGELIAAVATLATLVYLTIQIRQNTRALHGTFHDSHVNRMQAWQMAVATHPELSSIWHRAQQGDELTEQERNRLGLLRNYTMIGTEAVYYQFARGNIDPEIWRAQLNRIRAGLEQPDLRRWWREDRTFTFTQPFEALVESEIQAVGRPQ